jgi:CHASE3 domain sensor protein
MAWGRNEPIAGVLIGSSNFTRISAICTLSEEVEHLVQRQTVCPRIVAARPVTPIPLDYRVRYESTAPPEDEMARISHSKPLLLSFGLASTALVLTALLLLEWKGGSAAVESFEWVSHTLEVQRELATVEARMSEAEAGQRGYLLTSQASYLAPYTAATTDVRTRMANIRQLVAENKPQLQRMLKVEAATRAKLDELEGTIKLAQEGRRDSAVSIVTTNHSDSLMTSVRSGLQGMINAEQAVLRTRQRDLATELRQGDFVSIGLAAGLGLIMIALLAVARGAEHYRNLVTLCAWTRSVEYEGEWISFEEYLRRRFDLSTTHGISPDAISQLNVALDDQGVAKSDQTAVKSP